MPRSAAWTGLLVVYKYASRVVDPRIMPKLEILGILSSNCRKRGSMIQRFVAVLLLAGSCLAQPPERKEVSV